MHRLCCLTTVRIKDISLRLEKDLGGRGETHGTNIIETTEEKVFQKEYEQVGSN